MKIQAYILKLGTLRNVLPLVLLLLHTGVVNSQSRSYPKKLHERVLAKLNERRGDLAPSGKFGSWGKWSPWSPCSRSCGGGVSIQSRECTTTKVRKRVKLQERRVGNRCVGRYKRFQLCNTKDCPGGYADFRREQCAAFDRTPFNGRFYSWLPFIESPDSCTLNCRAVGLSFYATLNQTVVDGTPCGVYQPLNPRPNNKICVEGKCMKLGCDGLLGSGRRVDSCGVCGGDNTTCRLISGVYSRPNLPFGYNLIATLPSGAKNLSIFHMKPSSNYLALREVGGNYILNGPWGMNSSGSFEASGTVFTYSRPHAHGGDHLYARGPTTHSLDIMLFHQMPDPGIRYEYRLSPQPTKDSSISNTRGETHTFSANTPWGTTVKGPPSSGLVNDAITITRTGLPSPHKGSSQKREKTKKGVEGVKPKAKEGKKKARGGGPNGKKRRRRYHWIVSGFTACSQTCGGGTQTTRTICVKRRRKEVEAPTQFCAGLPLPRQKVVRCNLRPCPASWEANPWTPCSVTCGIGVQTRTMSCRQKVSPDLTIDVGDHECKEATPVITAQVCQLRDCSGEPQWEVGPWTPCSSECGLGNRKRNVTCTSMLGPEDDRKCKELKPLEEEMCDMGSCASDTWFISEWEKTCRGPCGEGTQSRRVHCSGNALELTKDRYTSCSSQSKPQETRPCRSDNSCSGSWFSGPWSECDVSCGTGHQWRPVVCVVWARGRYRVAKREAACKTSGQKPQDSRSCVVECSSQWFTSEWSECSAVCNNGVQRREVKCLNQEQKPSLECSSATKPDSRQSCNSQPCKEERLNDSADVSIRDESSHSFPNDSSSLEPNTRTNDPLPSESKEKSSRSNSKEPKCMDRMKNCHLVYKARLCRLKYYNKLCCETCLNY